MLLAITLAMVSEQFIVIHISDVSVINLMCELIPFMMNLMHMCIFFRIKISRLGTSQS